MLGQNRGEFRTTKTIDGEYCKSSYKSQYLWSCNRCSRYPFRPSSYLLVIIVFAVILGNLEYLVIFEVDLEGKGRLQVFL